MKEHVRAVRGATLVDSDDRKAIRAAVVPLVEEVVRINHIEQGDIVSIIFSQTADIRFNPATELRTAGFEAVPLFCTQEPKYEGSVPRMIRVLVTYSTDADEGPIPVYANGAERLRRDLFD